MSKDIIYIDTEDDITAIVGKIKSSKDDIIALVPPKRTGVLQSAVNLRLLARAAKIHEKHLVLITNSKSLIALSAAAKIPVAKTLQSKPEIAEIAALDIDEGEDVIEGANLPIGELEKTADIKDIEDLTEDIKNMNIEGEDPRYMPPSSDPKSKNKSKNALKVPDFGVFRKKLILGIGAGLVVIIFLVWAIWFAPAATVVITAKTQGAPISSTLTLGGPGSTDIESNTLQTVTKQLKKNITVEFNATGKADVGEKAKGSITVTNCDRSSTIPLPSGTIFTSSSGQKYNSDNDVTVPGLSGSASACRASGTGAGVVKVNVTAISAGDSYNINAASGYSISGVSGDVYAKGTEMTGGSSRMSTVVTQDDILKASQSLIELPTSKYKSELTGQFKNGEVVISESFTIDRAEAKSSPALNEEATSKATLTSEATFTIIAIPRADLEKFLNSNLKDQIDKEQRVYSSGIDKVSFSDFQKGESEITVNLAATGQVGPNIEKEKIKQSVKGKRYGDVQSLSDTYKGISNVDVKFSYFWVNTIPGDIKKINVEFVLTNA